MAILSASNLAKSYGAHDIFEGISVEIPHGAKIALVGSNGIGKTTLLNVLIKAEEPSAGVVSHMKGLRIGFLPQRPDLIAHHTLWEEMLTAFTDLRAREARLDVLVEHSMAIVSIDACDDREPAARIGGANAALIATLSASLAAVDVTVSPSTAPGIELSRAYFFNRAAEGGVELSFSAELLASLYAGQAAEERRQRLVAAVRDGLRQYLAETRSDLGRTMERFERDTARIPIPMRQTRGRPERNGE